MKVLGIEIKRVDNLNISVDYKGIITYHGSVDSVFRKIRTYKRNESLDASKDITQLLAELKKIDKAFEVTIRKLNSELVDDNLKLQM